FNAFFTCSSEIDISATYARRARGKPRAGAQQGKGASACPENASPLGTDGRGNAEGANIRRRNFLANALRTTRSTKIATKFIGPGNPSCSESDIRFRRSGEKAARPFRYKVRILPVGPGTVFRPHWIGRLLVLENLVYVA